MVSHHFSRFADGLVLVYVGIFSGLLFLDLIHDGINGKAEAGHAWQVADWYVELQRSIPPGVFGAAAALAAHRRLAQQLGAVEESCPHLDLEAQMWWVENNAVHLSFCYLGMQSF